MARAKKRTKTKPNKRNLNKKLKVLKENLKVIETLSKK
jgi:hypothetical protein